MDRFLMISVIIFIYSVLSPLIGGISLNFSDLCKCVYKSCPNFESQHSFITELFNAAGGGVNYSNTYKKQLFNGSKPFSKNQKTLLRKNDNLISLTEFFKREISNPEEVLISFGITEKDIPNKNALAVALAQQLKLIIKSDKEDVENILELQYQLAKQNTGTEINIYEEPLYHGDSISLIHKHQHVIQSYEKVEHSWELKNTGNIPWKGRKLVYKRGPKDRPEANPNIIEIPYVSPKESIKITTTFDGCGFDGVTNCVWEMQDIDGENCFPNRESLFSVIIDSKFKR